MVHNASDLLALALAYSDATGMPLTSLGVRACGNDKIFTGLVKGKSCMLSTAELAGYWFSEYWPDNAEWPHDVYRPEVSADWRRRLVLNEQYRAQGRPRPARPRPGTPRRRRSEIHPAP